MGREGERNLKKGFFFGGEGGRETLNAECEGLFEIGGFNGKFGLVKVY